MTSIVNIAWQGITTKNQVLGGVITIKSLEAPDAFLSAKEITDAVRQMQREFASKGHLFQQCQVTNAQRWLDDLPEVENMKKIVTPEGA